MVGPHRNFPLYLPLFPGCKFRADSNPFFFLFLRFKGGLKIYKKTITFFS